MNISVCINNLKNSGGTMKRRKLLKGIGAATTAFPFIGCSSLSGGKKFSNYEPKGEMPKRILGKTGIGVSMLGFGSHLNKELINNPELRDRMIKLGFKGGINLFDVYNRAIYKQYIPMSKSIRDFRKEMLISLYAVHGYEKLQEDIDYALKVFQTDYIDLYRFRHKNDEGFSIMERNKKAGKVRAIGISCHSASELVEIINNYGNSIDYVMIVYNFHHNKTVSRENAGPNDHSVLISLCRRNNIGILCMKPMGSDAMIELARKKGFFRDKNANIAQAMLRYVYQRNEIASTLTAMNSMEEVITNLESAYNPGISLYEEKMLSELSAVASSTGSAYLPPHYRWLENWAANMA